MIEIQEIELQIKREQKRLFSVE